MRKIAWGVTLALAVVGYRAVAAEWPEALRIGDDGTLKAGAVELYLQHFAPGWRATAQSRLAVENGYPQRGAGTYETRGRWTVAGSDAGYALTETLAVRADGGVDFRVGLTADNPVATHALFYVAEIPAGRDDLSVYVDGEALELPRTAGERVVFGRPAARKISLVQPAGVLDISGDFSVEVQDNRLYKIDTFSVRLIGQGADPAAGTWSLPLELRWSPPPLGRLPAGLKTDAFGGLLVDHAAFRWVFFRPGWRTVEADAKSWTHDGGFPKTGPGHAETAGAWRVDPEAEPFRARVALTAERGGMCRYAAEFEAPAAIPGESMALALELPIDRPHAVAIDGKPFPFPEQFKSVTLFRGRVRTFSVDLGTHKVTVEGDLDLLVQDDRKWKEGFQLRIHPRIPEDKRFRNPGVDFRIGVESHRTAAIDLRPACTMAFADDVAEDGKGGWTDQGPANDLSMLTAGSVSALGVAFAVVNPASNDNKSCIAVAGRRNGFPVAATVPVAVSGEPFSRLYLLHASAWTPRVGQPVGKLIVTYPDGTDETHDVLSGRDVGNWWEPQPHPNAAVAWTGENRESYVGLYLSQFPVKTTPRRIRFEAAPATVWMVVAAQLGDREIDMQYSRVPTYIVADDTWFPLRWDGTTAEGSPLDFSRYLDAPAGKYGPVVATPEGHFAFRDRPEGRVRFFGANLVASANYLDKPLADDFVRKAIRLGYNSVRFHHFENGLLDADAPDSLTFNPKALDQLQYLFAQLKRHGVYLCLDLYASRALRPGDGIVPDVKPTSFEMKVLAPISPSAMENWKRFARNLLTAPNPYTGLTMAEDPALYSLNLMNEAPLVYIWDRFPAVKTLYEAKYLEYLKEKNLDTPENREARAGIFTGFLTGLQQACIAEQRRFLKEELKLAALVTDINYVNKYTLAGLRGELDFVDNHAYWDHPRFPVRDWTMPYVYGQGSNINRYAEVPRAMMPTRVYGKPFTVTEFNICGPNVWRVEAAPLVGGYSALQDWDGLYRFAWSHRRERMAAMGAPAGFDIVNDIQAQLAERIIHHLFMRADAAPARPAYAFAFSPELIDRIPSVKGGDYPFDFQLLGLYGRLGTAVAGNPTPAGARVLDAAGDAGWPGKLDAVARTAMETLKRDGTVVSATGEIALDQKAKSVKVVTPRSEVLTFAGEAAGKVLSVKNASAYQTVALLSLDDKPLADSRSMLLVQLTNLAGTKQKFSDKRMTILEHWGTLPTLAERGRAEASLRLSGDVKVTALTLEGAPDGVVATKAGNGEVALTLDNAARPGGTMAYWIVR